MFVLESKLFADLFDRDDRINLSCRSIGKLGACVSMIGYFINKTPINQSNADGKSEDIGCNNIILHNQCQNSFRNICVTPEGPVIQTILPTLPGCTL